GAEVNLLEHTNAYGTLADNGIYHQPVSILKVTDANNNVLSEWKPNDGTVAVTPELSATITSVLSDDDARVYIFGRHSTLTLPDRPVAAKTGTTNDYKDAWTMGFTPSLVTGVWVGNTIPSPMKGGGNKLAGLIWNQFMATSTKNTPVETFPTPPPNDATKPVLRGADDGIKLQINSANGKIATSTTPPGLIITKTYLPPHDILFYINKNDPRGPAPTNPNDDPQYQNWENSLQDWIKRQQVAGVALTLEEPPTQYDNTPYNPELTPQVQIIAPTSNETINGRQLNIQVKASAPRGVKQVDYYIDEQLAGNSSQFPFDFSFSIPKLYSNQHTLKAVATDDQGNAGEEKIVFYTNAEFDQPTFSWIDGTQVTINQTDFPRTVSLKPVRWDDIKDIKIQLINSANKAKNIFDFNHKEDQLTDQGNLEFSWKNFPEVGKYVLKGTLVSNGGFTESKELDVEIK
ncbi:MAG: hypothetical protein HY979_02930, partial [Candidatus Magasanikbacteria bacterium]|nr:hypothetical protein [Candidatus Magasanikbacteria bacterium]